MAHREARSLARPPSPARRPIVTPLQRFTGPIRVVRAADARARLAPRGRRSRGAREPGRFPRLRSAANSDEGADRQTSANEQWLGRQAALFGRDAGLPDDALVIGDTAAQKLDEWRAAGSDWEHAALSQTLLYRRRLQRGGEPAGPLLDRSFGRFRRRN